MLKNILTFLRTNFPKRQLAVVTLLILSLTFWGCNPNNKNTSANADTQIDPKLEAQILEVIKKHPDVILEAVIKYQQEQQSQGEQKSKDAQQKFIADLKTNPKAVIGNSPVMGSQDYKIVIVEFSDFQCPFCAKAHGTLKTFMEKHGSEVTLAYKHLPLIQIHPNALPAAKAAWAAQQQGKFWEYHDRLFENQARLGEDFYKETAQKLGLDLAKFESDRANADASVKADFELAQQLGINGTPFFAMVSVDTGKTDLFSGAMPLEELEKKLANVKTK